MELSESLKRQTDGYLAMSEQVEAGKETDSWHHSPRKDQNDRRFLKGWLPKGWFCPVLTFFSLRFASFTFGQFGAVSVPKGGETQTKCSP